MFAIVIKHSSGIWFIQDGPGEQNCYYIEQMAHSRIG